MFTPGRLEEVVGVHEGVHDEVHDDEPPGRGRVLAEGVPAVDQHSHVVVPGEIVILLTNQTLFT